MADAWLNKNPIQVSKVCNDFNWNRAYEMHTEAVGAMKRQLKTKFLFFPTKQDFAPKRSISIIDLMVNIVFLLHKTMIYDTFLCIFY